MNTQTIVLPSSRAIRAKQLEIAEETLFLPNFITMSDFLSKLCVVADKKFIDDDTRVLLLLEASDFSHFAKLQIERNFFTFTKNASYIFKFFEELSAEMYDISLLETADIYAEYEEHILILQELYKRYEMLCNERGLLDQIFVPKEYTFHYEYLASHPKISLEIVGHLTNFELDILEQCCSYSSVEIIFSTTRFNTKMQEKFAKLGFDLVPEYRYVLDLNTKEILDKTSLKKETLIECEPLSESLLQVAFVKQKVYEFIQKGYAPEKIVVVVPDEQFAQTLKSFDTESNFNFAMGESFGTTQIFEKLYASAQAIENDSKENLSRLQRVGDAIYNELFPLYHKEIGEVDFVALMKSYVPMISRKVERKIYEEEIFHFKTILPFMQNMRVHSLVHLFLQRLRARTLDDVRGGKITVMGVLETRAVVFDGVVIVDFSDNNVPKKSQKDMFLNTQIRESAKLPTSIDRQNLQKHYYEMLINNSKEVAISYVSSSESSGSRFLKQLGIKKQDSYDESQLSSILFDKKIDEKDLQENDIVTTYDFRSAPLSASRLKSYLTCKRRFYYKYIAHISSHSIPTNMIENYEIGNMVHAALNDVYTKKQSYLDAQELQRDIEKALDTKIDKNSEIQRYFLGLQKAKMRGFSTYEVERFKDGWVVEECEKSLTCEFAGLTLTGQIDRLDIKDNEIYVIDYKTGNYPIYNKNNFTDATDFQLEFYYLLVRDYDKVIRCAYYDLGENKLVEEAFLEEKLAVLESNIKDMLAHDEINFEKCEDEKNCLYCDYKIICGRE